MDVRRLWGAALIASIAFGADAPQLDYTAAVPAVLRVLPYDVNFEARGNGPFVVLVVSADANSAQAAAALDERTVEALFPSASRWRTGSRRSSSTKSHRRL